MSREKQLYKAIIGGKYKGRKILLPSKSSTRSTKSILKESYFNSVQFDIEGRAFVEVFGGSGSMGLEALSRGAKKAYFIERDRDAYLVLKQNCALFEEPYEAIEGDSFKIYPSLIERVEEGSLIYFDPPFDIREGMEGIYDKVLELMKATPKEKALMISIEHISTIKFPEKIGEFRLKKRKKFGKSALTHFV